MVSYAQLEEVQKTREGAGEEKGGMGIQFLDTIFVVTEKLTANTHYHSVITHYGEMRSREYRYERAQISQTVSSETSTARSRGANSITSYGSDSTNVRCLLPKKRGRLEASRKDKDMITGMLDQLGT